MSQLMENLFCLLDSPQTEAKAQVYAATNDIIQTAEQRLTHEEFENLWNAVFDIKKADDLNSFTLGFRLGVQLMLEGLRPISLD